MSGSRYTAIERFLDKVLLGGSGCWEWQGWRGPYGELGDAGRRVGAHRFSYEVAFGPIPEGLSVLHRCDNPPCVRPTHLFLGTQSDNTTDAYMKERNSRARLSVAAVMEIRQRLANGETRNALAREFQVSPGHVIRIKSRLRWSAA